MFEIKAIEMRQKIDETCRQDIRSEVQPNSVDFAGQWGREFLRLITVGVTFVGCWIMYGMFRFLAWIERSRK